MPIVIPVAELICEEKEEWLVLSNSIKRRCMRTWVSSQHGFPEILWRSGIWASRRPADLGRCRLLRNWESHSRSLPGRQNKMCNTRRQKALPSNHRLEHPYRELPGLKSPSTFLVLELSFFTRLV